MSRVEATGWPFLSSGKNRHFFSVSTSERFRSGSGMTGDAGELIQAIINLVTNAAQAIAEKLGTITVEVAVAIGERLPHEPGRSSGTAICLSVSDTGCGMDQATVARLFEPFFTTKPVGEGTGLGLSVVHGIVTQHGGSIRVDSRVDEGTRFDVYLPALAAAASPTAEQTASPAL